MNVTEQAHVGKDQVGNGVKETTNPTAERWCKLLRKSYKSVRYGKSSHRSKSFAVISWNCCRSTAVFFYSTTQTSNYALTSLDSDDSDDVMQVIVEL